MEVNPEKLNGTPHHFYEVFLHSTKNCYSYYLSFNLKGIIHVRIPKIQFDVNFANGFAVDVANDVLSVCWMRYPFRLNQ